MTDKTYPPSAEMAAAAHIDAAKYKEMYDRSIADPEGFWGDAARERLDWIKPFTKVKNTTYAYPDVSIKWYEDGVLNVSATCIDRHLATAEGSGARIVHTCGFDSIPSDLGTLFLQQTMLERFGEYADQVKSLKS